MSSAVPPPSPQEQTAIRRATKKLQLPLVSGASSAAMLFFCLVVSAAIVFPLGMAANFSPWIRFELVLVAWWAVWSAALAHFLFYGRRVSDDHQHREPRKWWPTGQGAQKTGAGGGGGGWTDLSYVGGDAEGCAWVIGIIVAIVAVFALAWLLIEVIIPLLALIFYALIRGMLARVANDSHHCTGRFSAAFLWGTLWATLYTAPLALLVFIIHLIVAHKNNLA